MPIILSKKAGGGGSGGGVTSFSESGQPALTGAVTLSEGSGVTLTQVGQDIEIASSGGAMALLSDTVLGATAASFDITGIAGTYRHLLVVFNARSDRAGANFDFVRLRFNNDSGNNYNWEWFQTAGGASGAAESSIRIGVVPGATATAGDSGSLRMQIPSYAATTFNKVLDSSGYDRRSAGGTIGVAGGLWSNTAAVTRITIFPEVGPNWVAGSSLTIYGLS